MNVILGGGLIAMLAKDILGWTVIPVGRSRYYSFNPPLSDNFVVSDAATNDYMKQFTALPIMHRVAFSYAGQVMFHPTLALQPYLAKLYGKVPTHIEHIWKNRLEFIGHGDCLDMYKSLQEKYKIELADNNTKYGKPKSIKDHVITTDTGVRIAYERIISTVPLYALIEWLGYAALDLPSRDLYCYHIRTDCLDFEGATQLLVADPEIQFHKVAMLNKANYVFYSCNPITQPGQYFFNFMQRFDLVAETAVEKAICCGDIPDVSEVLSTNGIECIGKSAVWDDALDVGSCIKRLLKVRTDNV